MQIPFLKIKNTPHIPVIPGVENNPPSKAPINRQHPKNERSNVWTNLLFLIASNNVIPVIGINKIIQ